MQHTRQEGRLTMPEEERTSSTAGGLGSRHATLLRLPTQHPVHFPTARAAAVQPPSSRPEPARAGSGAVAPAPPPGQQPLLQASGISKLGTTPSVLSSPRSSPAREHTQSVPSRTSSAVHHRSSSSSSYSSSSSAATAIRLTRPRTKLGGLLALAVFALLLPCSPTLAQEQQQQQQQVNIGLLSCLSDSDTPVSPLGDVRWEAILHECVNASIPPGANFSVNIVHRNIGVDIYPTLLGVPDTWPPEVGTVFSAAQSLVERDRVVAVFGACTLETTREAQSFLSHARVPQINFRTTASLVTPNRLTSSYYAPFLQFAVPTIVELGAAAASFIKDQGWRKFVILASSSPMGGRAVNAIENAIKTNTESAAPSSQQGHSADAEALSFTEVRYPSSFFATNVSIETSLQQIRSLRKRVIVLVGETRQDIFAVLYEAYKHGMLHETYAWIVGEDFSDLAWQDWPTVFAQVISDPAERLVVFKAIARVVIQIRVAEESLLYDTSALPTKPILDTLGLSDDPSTRGTQRFAAHACDAGTLLTRSTATFLRRFGTLPTVANGTELRAIINEVSQSLLGLTGPLKLIGNERETTLFHISQADASVQDASTFEDAILFYVSRSALRAEINVRRYPGTRNTTTTITYLTPEGTPTVPSTIMYYAGRSPYAPIDERPQIMHVGYAIQRSGTATGTSVREREGAFQSAVEFFNSRDPNQLVQLTYTIVDVGTPLETACEDGARRLIEVDAHAIVGPGKSSCAILMQNVLNSTRFNGHPTPQIGISETSPVLSDKSKYPGYFRMTSSDVYQGIALADLIARFGIKTLGTIASTDANGISLADAFERHWTSDLGNSLDSRLRFDSTFIHSQIARLGEEIAKLKRDGGAAIQLVSMVEADAEHIFQSLLNGGLAGEQYTFLGTDASSGAAFPDIILKAIKGMVALSPKSAGGPLWEEFIQFPGSLEFNKLFIESINKNPDAVSTLKYVPHIVDAVHSVHLACERQFQVEHWSTSPQKEDLRRIIADGLRTFNSPQTGFFGCVNASIWFDENQDGPINYDIINLQDTHPDPTNLNVVFPRWIKVGTVVDGDIALIPGNGTANKIVWPNGRDRPNEIQVVPPPASSDTSNGSHQLVIIVTVLGVCVFLFLFVLIYLRVRTVNLSTELKKAQFVFPPVDHWELPRRNIRKIKQIGSGAFGVVFHATVSGLDGHDKPLDCAIKVIKREMEVDAKRRIVEEARVMKRIGELHHTNVLQLIGVCMQAEPLMIVFERCIHGDLRSYLHAQQFLPQGPGLTLKDLLRLATDAARGMSHIHEHGILHRDLAARNCLVSEAEDGVLVLKIADFGASIDFLVSHLEYYRRNAEEDLPVRWLPPECLQDGIYDFTTDVWSFGVLLWEIMTWAQLPYPSMGNGDVYNLVCGGYIMPRPPGCAHIIYNLMKKCWDSKDKRPSFQKLLLCLEDLLQLCEDGKIKTFVESRAPFSLGVDSSEQSPPNPTTPESQKAASRKASSNFAGYCRLDDISIARDNISFRSERSSEANVPLHFLESGRTNFLESPSSADTLSTITVENPAPQTSSSGSPQLAQKSHLTKVLRGRNQTSDPATHLPPNALLLSANSRRRAVSQPPELTQPSPTDNSMNVMAKVENRDYFRIPYRGSPEPLSRLSMQQGKLTPTPYIPMHLSISPAGTPVRDTTISIIESWNAGTASSPLAVAAGRSGDKVPSSLSSSSSQASSEDTGVDTHGSNQSISGNSPNSRTIIFIPEDDRAQGDFETTL